MNFVKFHIRDTLTRTYYNMDRWLVSAQVGTKTVCFEDMGIKNFFETIESMDGLISDSDLDWVNEICRLVLKRDYKQPSFKRPPVATASNKRKEQVSIQEQNIMREMSAKNDRASVRR